MVKKLLKHELLAMGRVVVLVQAILLVAAVFMRILLCFEEDQIVYNTVAFFAWLLYALAVVACLLVPFIMGVLRYYRNLFTAEGYLTFTLPVTPAQHILVKVLSSLIWSAASVVTALLSFGIVTFGDVFREVMLAMAYLTKDFSADLWWNVIGWVLELIVLLSLTYVAELLLYNACISVGQLARKNRILTAVGVYFGYYVVTQILETVLVVVFELIQDRLPIERWLEAMSKHLYLTIHLSMCGLIVLTALFAGLYFLVSHGIIRKRLNLE